MKSVLLFCMTLSCITLIQSPLFSQQGFEGLWATYDDNTGKLESEVELFIKNGKLYGKIIKLYGISQDAICVNCTDYRKNKPIVGMVFMSGLTQNGKEWIGDNALLHPDNGKLYSGKVWLDSKDRLAVRGYLGWFYRTQYWKRVKCN